MVCTFVEYSVLGKYIHHTYTLISTEFYSHWIRTYIPYTPCFAESHTHLSPCRHWRQRHELRMWVCLQYAHHHAHKAAAPTPMACNTSSVNKYELRPCCARAALRKVTVKIECNNKTASLVFACAIIMGWGRRSGFFLARFTLYICFVCVHVSASSFVDCVLIANDMGCVKMLF